MKSLGIRKQQKPFIIGLHDNRIFQMKSKIQAKTQYFNSSTAAKGASDNITGANKK